MQSIKHSTYDVAKAYQGLGWAIMPVHTPIDGGGCSCEEYIRKKTKDPKYKCPSTGKHPKIRLWQEEASTNAEKANKWFNNSYKNNIGIATGKKSGVTVIDIDINHQIGKFGDESLEHLEQKLGKLPDTVEQKTGGGGRQLFFKQFEIPGFELKNSAGIIGESIDIRSDGGMVVVYPSMHKSGNQYIWEESSKPGSIEIAELPSLWIDYIRNCYSKKDTNGKSEKFKMPEKIDNGKRNDTFFRSACSMHEKGLSRNAILAALKEENIEKCDIPLEESELITIIDNVVARYEQGQGYKSESESGVKVIAKPHSGDDLLRANLPPISFIMQDFLTVGGVYLLAGGSKMGKTWLSLDMSISISQGMPFMGKATKKTPVLYIDRESSETSLKSRILAMHKNGVDLSNWSYIHKCNCLFDGLQEHLCELIERYGYKLIFIDVFAKIRSEPDKGMSEYKHDYKDIGALKEIAEKYNACFVILHHQRKMKDEDDIFNTMSGSTGLMGAPDGAILLARKRGASDAILHTEGRDIRGDQYSIRWDDTKLMWQYIGRSEEIKDNFEKVQFLDSPLVEVITKILQAKNGEIYTTIGQLFDNMIFDYPEIKPVPTTSSALAKELKENVIKFRDAGIIIEEGKKGNKGRNIKISFAVTPITHVTPVTPVTPVTFSDDGCPF